MSPQDYLSKEEIKSLLVKSNWRAALEFVDTWFWISFAFALAGFIPHVFTIIIAMFILGGKQLACAILMHDCSHRSMFTSTKANEFFGNWFAGYPIFHDVKRYRPYHIKHHVTTGTPEDPDLPLTKGYPTTLKSFIRKMLRDFSGATGIKGYYGVFMMHFGRLHYTLGGLVIWENMNGKSFMDKVTTVSKNLYGPVITNLIMLGIFFLVGAPWLYLLWVGSLLTTHQFCIRIRSIAEHSVVPDKLDPQLNTRTTYANFIEQMLFAPHNVNYHAEHHLLMTVPSYNLPKMHRMIKERGYFEKGLLKKGYIDIIQLAIGK